MISHTVPAINGIIWIFEWSLVQKPSYLIFMKFPREKLPDHNKLTKIKTKHVFFLWPNRFYHHKGRHISIPHFLVDTSVERNELHIQI